MPCGAWRRPADRAGELRTLSLQTALPDLREQAVAAARAAADLLREIDPPAPALAAHLAFRYTVQHELVLRVIEAGRPTDAARLADEAIALGRRAAAAPGADVRTVAGGLRTLSLQTALPDLREQAVAAARAAADLLREIDPPAPALAEHLAFRYTVQHEFVLRVIEAGRPTDAARLADEAIALGRRAAAAPGADVRGVASQLHTLSLQTALPDLRAQSVAAAVAAADLLRPLEPPMPALAPHLMLRGTVLRDLTLRLIEAGRTPEAAGPADEAIFVLKRAVVAGGNAPSIRQVLSSFALQLAGGGLQAQSEAAQQAAQEIPEG